MRTTVLIVTLFFLSGICKSQISLEHSFLASSKYTNASVVNLSHSGYKYVVQDEINYTVKLYNLNHSFWKTIPLNIPVGYTIIQVRDISETLFNLDTLLELAYSYYRTQPTIDFVYKIINENNNILLTIPNCKYAYAVSTGANGWKLIAEIDSTNSYSIASNNIYSLVGTMPIMISENGVNNSDVLSYPFPNPSQSSTIINYQLPDGNNSAEIVFYNLNGQEIKRFTVDNSFNTLELNNADLPSGTYLYQLVSRNFITPAKQMIIIK